MSVAMFMGNDRQFGALLERVLRQRREEATAPSGFQQRLSARLAQETVFQMQRFAFAESVDARRSPASIWAAVAAHVVVLTAVFVLAVQHPLMQKQVIVTHLNELVPPPLLLPSVHQIGGGGGAKDVAPVTQGQLPKFAEQAIGTQKAPPMDAPKLTLEPTILVQSDLKMATNNMPNFGLPNAPAVSMGSLGTGNGAGIGSGNGNGVGPGVGGNTGGGVYHLGGGVRAPIVLQQVDPEYSEEARKAKFSGNVLVELIVDEQGNPLHVHVVQGVGLGLDEKAVEAVRQYRFKPATKDGKPVKVALSVEVNFQIF
jgi:periplasmic protein TonB